MKWELGKKIEKLQKKTYNVFYHVFNKKKQQLNTGKNLNFSVWDSIRVHYAHDDQVFIYQVFPTHYTHL